MKKIILRVVVALAVLLVVAIVAIGLFLDTGIKRAVETFGPKITQVSVKLDKVSLSLLSGTGGIQGLVVGNPEGYKTPQAISVGNASLALRPGSLLSDKIVIKSIKVDAPEITLEAGLNGSNLGQILANVEQATRGTNTNAPAAESKPASASEAPGGKKLEVDEFIISNAKLNLSLTGLGGKSATLSLPTIQLANLGQGPEGITGAELTKLVLNAIYDAARKAATDSGNDIGKMAEQLKGNLLKGVDKGTVEDVNKLGKSIGDLLKKKSK